MVGDHSKMSKVVNFEYNNIDGSSSIDYSLYNVNYDLIWSFKFALTGDALSNEGGFTTFLKLNNEPLSGGGEYNALGYLPGDSSVNDVPINTESEVDIITEDDDVIFSEPSVITTSINGLISAFLAVGFDTSGYFALSTLSYDGVQLPSSPSLTVRGGYPNYNLLYTTPLSTLSTEFTLLSTTVNYCWLRFRLGNVCSKLFVDYRYGDGSSYIPLTSIPVTLQFTDTTMVKVGISYTTPLTAVDGSKTTLLIKSFTVEGTTLSAATSAAYTSLSSVGETILIVQSGGDIATQDEHIVLT